MKLPIIRQFYQNNSAENLEKAVEVLESFTEFRGVTDEQLSVIGDMMTDMLGAIEVHEQVKNGTSEKDALNGFAQKVMGSIDR
ncbi:DUF6952 family protein [Bergeyella zoohelcum]|uniref:Uncharacterized protein n=1 Tax=Bergeyella zoohelcum TaxID=1015 RepID=A0A380ZV72_9FLAO|nr:hypothetical protein [Bergeyella zoohelcum]EKB60196.1 hypothetical protein HMPREF9700_01233 [Bergeyella zoohelcum CCUG 30536]MDY6025483.1 hypothetical protein [Bergeyella zoohelcum]SUV52905.1 Uncharacterised protein [Bergeyella zoohelcum]